ncbi:MAG TPA: Fe-Mn family superoxide dismutase [bacterium]|nr:Fe-Mn family superoxide dismutase [bacterium]
MGLKHLAGLAVIATICVTGAACSAQDRKPAEDVGAAQTAYAAKDYSSLKGTPGFSDTILDNHFKLYQGYVKNTNALAGELAKLNAGGQDRTPQYAELKRRFGWEFNGMRFHEYYFENIGPSSPLEGGDALAKKISVAFGSVDNWRKDFVSTGMMRGIGWVVLTEDGATGNLFNTWVNEHDAGVLAGSRPLLVMDVFEHAYVADYGLERAKYIEAFMNNVKWDEVKKRLQKE